MPETLKDKTARGLFWGAMNNGTMQLLNILFGIFLGRLLSPAETGIVGVLAIFTLLAGNLQASGFMQALINEKNPGHRDYNSVFWFNVIVSLALYGILFASAPLIAAFFRQPVLVQVSRFVFLAFVISSLGIVPHAFMLKRMMNREIAVTTIVALVVSGVAGVALAWQGYSYWSLAWQQVIYITVNTVLRYAYCRWHPTLNFDFGPVRRMMGFSVKVLVSQVVNTLSGNILTFIFGRLFPIHDVGNYSQANNWNTKANSFISGTVGQIAQPVLAQVAGDQARTVAVFRKLLRFTAFFSFPLMLGLSLVGREFILLTIGEKWLGCVPLLQVLCVSGAFAPIFTLYQGLAVSQGRSGVYMWCNVAQLLCLVAIVVACSSWGMMVMVTAYALFSVVWLLVWHLATRPFVPMRLRWMLADVAPFLLIALATMAATHFATAHITHIVVQLCARVAMAALIYVAVMKLLRVRMLDECVAWVKKKIKRQ